MNKFFIEVLVYLVFFGLSLFSLDALDFNRLLKKNRVLQAQILYFLIALSIAYLSGSLFLEICYYFR